MAGKEALRLVRMEKEHFDKEKNRRVRRIFERESRPPWWERALQIAIIALASMVVGAVLGRLL